MPHILTVSEVNKYIKGLLAYDGVLSSIWIEGEISNYKRHYTGHLYFTVKDSASLLKCVMFKTYADKLLFEPKDGMKVIIRGNVSVFERDGIYQLYAEDIKTDGIGDLHTAFEQLKKKLDQEGLFDPALKKKIPYMPGTVGILTSETGSVIKDMINVLTRRFYPVRVKLYPCAVQGAGAEVKLADGIKFFNRNQLCDVIIIARGGGSLEDLWPFNEEILARAIYESEIPVISGVGHETDFTICDFVADLRAPTPSAAAELAVPELSEIRRNLDIYKKRAGGIPWRNLEVKRKQLENIRSQRVFKRPYDMIKDSRIEVDSLGEDIIFHMKDTLKDAYNRKALLAVRLDSASPLKILGKGYGAITDKDGNIVNSINKVSDGERISVNLNDGILDCDVINRRKSKYGGE